MICIMLVFNSCKKEKEDYRVNYIGDWDFVVERIYYTGWFTEHDTVFYSGIIFYGSYDTTLNITYYKNNTLLDVSIDKFGTLDNFFNRPTIRGQFEGNDKVHIEYSNLNPAGLGDTRIIDGAKKRGGKE